MENNLEIFKKKLLEVQSNIQQVEHSIRYIDSENKMDSRESDSKIKKNDQEIKQLNMEIKELRIRMERGRKVDEITAAKALDKCSLDDRNIQGKSAKEIIQQIDSEVIELEKRKKELDHELELQKRSYGHSDEEFQKNAAEYDDDFENEPTEEFCQQKTRELQKEQQDIESKILDNEVAEGVLKRMKIQFQKILLSQAQLYLDAKKELRDLEKSTEEWVFQPSNSSRNSPKKSSLKYSEEPHKDASDRKRVQFTKEESSQLQAYINEQECEFHEMKESLSKIRDATGVSDIKDIEGRILELKSLHEDLVDLKKRLAKTLQELKATKRQQDTKMDIFKGANANGPKRELEETVKLTKRRLIEQEKRKEGAKKELQAVNNLLECTRPKLLKILKLIGKKIPEDDSSLEEINILDLAKKLENFFQNIKGKDDQHSKEKGDYQK